MVLSSAVGISSFCLYEKSTRLYDVARVLNTVLYSEKRFGFYNFLALHSIPSIVCMLSRYSLMDVSKVNISSKYTRDTSHLTFGSIMSVTLSDTLVPGFRPSGLFKSLQSPWRNVNVVFQSCASLLTRQYPKLASIVEYAHFVRQVQTFIHSSIWEAGYQKLTVPAFGILSSKREQSYPFFFLDNAIDDVHSDWAAL